MLLLAIDTSGRHGGITLARGEGNTLQTIASANLVGGTFSAELIPQIADLLQKHSYRASDLEGLIAVTGPGSFTGLRVGLSAVKGLAEALHLKIATVSSLEAIAFCALSSGENVATKIMSLIDAGRREVYAGIFEQQKSGAHKINELLLPAPEAIAMAKAQGLRVATIDASLTSAFPEVVLVDTKLSEAAARIGWRKLSACEAIDVLSLDANYIRKSEAEYAKVGQSQKNK